MPVNVSPEACFTDAGLEFYQFDKADPGDALKGRARKFLAWVVCERGSHPGARVGIVRMGKGGYVFEAHGFGSCVLRPAALRALERFARAQDEARRTAERVAKEALERSRSPEVLALSLRPGERIGDSR